MGNILKSQMAFTHRLHNQCELQENRSKVIWNEYERGRDLENTVNIKGDDLNGFDILLLSNSDMSDQYWFVKSSCNVVAIHIQCIEMDFV